MEFLLLIIFVCVVGLCYIDKHKKYTPSRWIIILIKAAIVLVFLVEIFLLMEIKVYLSNSFVSRANDLFWLCIVFIWGPILLLKCIVWTLLNIYQKLCQSQMQKEHHDEKFERLFDKSSKIDEYFNATMTRSENTLDKEKRQSKGV